METFKEWFNKKVAKPKSSWEKLASTLIDEPDQAQADQARNLNNASKGLGQIQYQKPASPSSGELSPELLKRLAMLENTVMEMWPFQSDDQKRTARQDQVQSSFDQEVAKRRAEAKQAREELVNLKKEYDSTRSESTKRIVAGQIERALYLLQQSAIGTEILLKKYRQDIKAVFRPSEFALDQNWK